MRREAVSSRAPRGIRTWPARCRSLALLGMAWAIVACTEGGEIKGLRLATKSYRFTITPNPIPPYANEDISYTVEVIDRDNGQPVQTGEGQIYGQLRPGPDAHPRTWDSFTYGPEVGVYHAKLRFAIASVAGKPDEAWQMGLRFRRDSLSPIEVVNWTQQVRDERPPGDTIRR
jgi:hypothetical protein